MLLFTNDRNGLNIYSALSFGKQSQMLLYIIINLGRYIYYYHYMIYMLIITLE